MVTIARPSNEGEPQKMTQDLESRHFLSQGVSKSS